MLPDFMNAEVDEGVELTAEEARRRALEGAEQAIDAAFSSGRADRAAITRAARDDANDAVRLVGEAMDADEEADDAWRLAVIAENMGNPEKTKAARKRAKSARKDAKQAHRAATKAAKEAYDAIKYSQPGKLGFMRAVQVMYAVNIVTQLLALLMTSRDIIVYNSLTIIDWVTLIIEAIGFWFFINSFKAAKPTVIAAAICSSVAAIISCVNGSVGIFGTITSLFFQIFLIVYMLRSKRVGTVLVNSFSSFIPKVQADAAISRRGWPLVRNLIIYFVVFSVLGHWMEAGMCQFIRLGWVQGEYDPTNTMLWRDWLYPYPMEGIAVDIIAVVLYPLWQYLLKRFDKPVWAYVASFVANALTCSLIEFTMGLLVNANHQLWDYSEMPFNIMGQVCLQNALAFGVAASVIAWVVYPMMERWLSRIPNDTMNIAFVIIAAIGGILWSLYLFDPPQNHALPAPDDAAQEAREQADANKASLDMASIGIGVLKGSVSDSTYLSPEELDAINAKLSEVESDINELSQMVEYKDAA